MSKKFFYFSFFWRLFFGRFRSQGGWISGLEGEEISDGDAGEPDGDGGRGVQLPVHHGPRRCGGGMDPSWTANISQHQYDRGKLDQCGSTFERQRIVHLPSRGKEAPERASVGPFDCPPR